MQCPPALLAVLRGLLAWHPLGRVSERWKAGAGAGRQRRGSEECAARASRSEHQRQNPPLVRVLLTASGACIASQLLPLPFFCLLLPGHTASPPGELENLPDAPKAGWKGGSVAGSSSISRTSRNVLPGEPPWLPPSFFIHENSISLGAGCQRQPLKRGVLWPPLPRAGPRPSGQPRAVPGQFLTRLQGRRPHSADVHTPPGVPHKQTAWQPDTGRSGSPGHTPESRSTPKTKSHTHSK